MKILKNVFFINLFLVLFLVGCKKESKDLTTVNFHLFNPATGEAFSGVTVKIILKKQKKGKPFVLDSEYESTEIWEGVTDADGKASYSFNAYENNKYQYWSLIDQGDMYGYEAIIQPTYESLTKDVINNEEYQYTKKASYVRWIKNDNFLDANDKFSYRLRSIAYPSQPWGTWAPFGQEVEVPISFYEGDMDHITSIITENQNIWEIEMMTIRNGISTTTLDTFYFTGQYVVDTMKLFY